MTKKTDMTVIALRVNREGAIEVFTKILGPKVYFSTDQVAEKTFPAADAGSLPFNTYANGGTSLASAALAKAGIAAKGAKKLADWGVATLPPTDGTSPEYIALIGFEDAFVTPTPVDGTGIWKPLADIRMGTLPDGVERLSDALPVFTDTLVNGERDVDALLYAVTVARAAWLRREKGMDLSATAVDALALRKSSIQPEARFAAIMDSALDGAEGRFAEQVAKYAGKATTDVAGFAKSVLKPAEKAARRPKASAGVSGGKPV
jgi:hypothetical protein